MRRRKSDSGEKSVSVFRRRWRKFRTLKRGWYSFLALVVMYTLSVCAPLLVNYRALVVSHDGELYFPAFGGHVEASVFGQRKLGEADYRALAEEFEEAGEGDWLLMPLYPYGPLESFLRDDSLEGRPPHPPAKAGAHVLGTDNRARDVFARLLYGFRNSITFALGVVVIGYAIGVTIGSILGYFGGRVDMFGQRLVEIWAAIPFLYTVIIVSSIVRPNIWVLIAVLSLFYWMGISYYIRGEFYREKAKDYVAAAIAQGESHASVMFRHIFPNALTPIVSYAPFAIVASIIALVSLDFLGFGLPAPTPSWGEMVNQGLQNIEKWHLVFFPLAAMFVTLLLIVFVGEAIREAFDPKVFSRLR